MNVWTSIVGTLNEAMLCWWFYPLGALVTILSIDLVTHVFSQEQHR